MSLWRRVRAELTGAWRSVRYDMGRRPVQPAPGGPDMTSTGMNTFGGPVFAEFVPPRRPRRALAVTGLGVLTVVGATGAYLGVVNGLGSLLKEPSAAADTVPARPAATSTFTPNTGIGQGPVPAVHSSRRTPAVGLEPAADAPGPATTDPIPSLPPQPANVSPIRTTNTAKPGCRCDSPPVPTPTAPSSSASPTPSGSASPSASVSPSETSATPSDSVEPSESPDSWHRHRRQ
ncbi:hypothetical protein BJ973_005410 [Actinoplanes tereljensis]|uniref:Uncharacterized protein n=1 Tax=Paractinoplanes tereljensis TaxID=571912 RepID=A0A919NNR3_9ACTN|nr:hypothetical protein [Actinoplanes tereljensis]GIF21137.1 hypothetical protein Ate02nite_38670 [Actinoplanes tereljensis]